MDAFVEFSLHHYNDLPSAFSTELYSLRKKTFRERLGWKVECADGMEKDRFDNENATYLLGVHDGRLLCGARFIDIMQPTMISEIFCEYFDGITLPDDIPCCEISRLFLDKERRDAGNLRSRSTSKALFLAMIVYCMKKQYRGMYAVASRGMFAIFRHANWKVEVIKKGLSEKGETIYYIFMPASESIAEDIIIKDRSERWLREMFRSLQDR
ncbi:acyl-homoserine-lactone synthase [Pluralibacter sp.]|jgi:acyl homoserine lactone synthase|uniref:acyl-homoserine-lactone synthase n=1 Tax=Pluralibacter sp. TaxID=1920032 RepID=UPI0025D184B1|nr:acyl-homoserine-lactone synthase [Pluralibacter sp.]MBV8042881.1 acyl homoserine lactone synthase [Pluralibacter sp.]